MKTLKVFFGVVAALVFLGGCASPEVRIRRHPDLFAQLTPGQQDLIRRGQIAIGFTPDMVRLAVGEPDRYRTRTDMDGTSEIWSYVTYDRLDGMPLYRGWYHRHYLWGDPLYPWYLSTDTRRERERFRVIFRNNRVEAIEQEMTR